MDGACSTHMGKNRRTYKSLVGKPDGKRRSEDLGEDVRIILEWILGKHGGKMLTGCIWIRIGTSGGLL